MTTVFCIGWILNLLVMRRFCKLLLEKVIKQSELEGYFGFLLIISTVPFLNVSFYIYTYLECKQEKWLNMFIRKILFLKDDKQV